MDKMRTVLRFSCLMLLGASLTLGCAGTDTFQNKMKGLWVLQSRTLPDGTEVGPPAVSGRLEWFPMNVEAKTAHVSMLLTHGDEGLQIHGSHYDLNDYSTFTQTDYLQVGGGINKTHDQTYTMEKITRSGTISVDGSKITFQHENGPTYTFQGSKLTIKHRDGTVDVLMK